MAAVADLLAEDVEVVLTHGNGPQVGNLLVKNEIAASVVPPVPLDWCGAQTQATLGFVLMNALQAALGERDLDRRTATVVTRTLVAADDPGFARPEQADRPLPGGRGSRRTHGARGDLGGPRREGLAPRGGLARAGGHPRCARHPGHGAGRLRGDRGRWRRHPRRARGASACVGSRRSSTRTSVPRCWPSWSRPTCCWSRPTCPTRCSDSVRRRPSRSARSPSRKCAAYAAEGHFASGSMGPKVDAVCRFVEPVAHAA